MERFISSSDLSMNDEYPKEAYYSTGVYFDNQVPGFNIQRPNLSAELIEKVVRKVPTPYSQFNSGKWMFIQPLTYEPSIHVPKRNKCTVYLPPHVQDNLEEFIEKENLSSDFTILMENITATLKKEQIAANVTADIFRDVESPEWVKINLRIKTGIKDRKERDQLWYKVFDNCKNNLKFKIFNIFIE
jgi:hypothetical protein